MDLRHLVISFEFSTMNFLDIALIPWSWNYSWYTKNNRFFSSLLFNHFFTWNFVSSSLTWVISFFHKVRLTVIGWVAHFCHFHSIQKPPRSNSSPEVPGELFRAEVTWLLRKWNYVPFRTLAEDRWSRWIIYSGLNKSLVIINFCFNVRQKNRRT